MDKLSPVWTIPFAGILLCIALCPLFTPHFWHHHFKKVSVAWAVLLAAPFIFFYGHEAVHEILHIYLVDYIPFIILLWSLFTISGGILVRGGLSRVPWLNNSLMMLLGTLLASWVGTTGASMLLIRPVLRANANRRYKAHTVVFFIFLVSNIGGALTPLGDPPLFLGFLHHVPFFWTLTALWMEFLVTSGLVLLIYVALDFCIYRFKEPEEVRQSAPDFELLSVQGLFNFALLGGVVGGVLLSGYWKPHFNAGAWLKNGAIVVLADHADQPANAEAKTHEPDAALAEHADDHGHGGLGIPVQNIARDVILILAGLVSLWLTPKTIREANGFSWGPISEVAWLFAGIFMTIIPALKILAAGEAGRMAPLMRIVTEPAHYFWATGLLSSFLDNAPTYLTFFNSSLGKFFPGMPEASAVQLLIAEKGKYLAAISVGAVFMGANTYIGNAPNFMVKSIAEEAGIAMPDFISYIFKYSVPVLIPVFVIVTIVFFS